MFSLIISFSDQSSTYYSKVFSYLKMDNVIIVENQFGYQTNRDSIKIQRKLLYFKVWFKLLKFNI